MQNNKNKPARGLFARRDVWIVAGVLVVALVLWLVLRGGTKGSVALVTIGTGAQQTEQTIPLTKNKVYHIKAALPVQLEVKDGAIHFINSVCPDHKCESFGLLRHEGDWAACLPAGVTVRVQTT